MKLIVLLLLSGPCSLAVAESRLTLPIENQEFELHRYPAEGKYLALWFASGNGLGERHAQIARGLQQLGIETWQIDLLENLFLPKNSKSIRRVDANLPGKLIEQAQRESGKRVVVISNTYGAILALRGMRAWQQAKHKDNGLVGAVMFTPYAYQGIPSLGLPPEYIPEAHATNMPLMILQSARNGNRQQLDDLLAVLHEGGSNVFVQLMPGATSMFYDEDQAEATIEHLKQSPRRILRAIHLMEKLPHPVAAAPLPGHVKVNEQELGLDIGLKPFRGNWSPPPLELDSANSRHYALHDYTGKVRIINFWATWCPPCVEEIPSLNGLREKFDNSNFELISVNYAQQANEVKDFLDKVEVNFPVLIDHDGRVSNRWRVIAFPSTYVIDANGRIRYGVNAAIRWDTPQVVDQLQQLINEKAN
ncbi:MAG: TlpA disulfide reductase family protein [Thiohalophilus sp.]|jgi:thiol-disulfide isomerase/thioredoxin